MIETIVDSIRVNLITQNRVLFLREVEGERHLPIWIGDFEAQAIILEMRNETPQRPLPYDIIMSMLGDLDARITRVVVNDLSHDIYYARIVMERTGESFELDARPSDAIAIAIRASCPIFVDDTVMDRAGVAIAEEHDETDEPESQVTAADTAGGANEEGLNLFRDFINNLDIDDIDKRPN